MISGGLQKCGQKFPTIGTSQQKGGLRERSSETSMISSSLPDGSPSLLAALAAHLIGVPAVVADKLEAFFGNMLSDGGDKVAGGEDFKVAADLGMHAGAVDDGSGFRIGMHLFNSEGVADDVLSEPLEIFFLMRLDVLAAVDAEAAVFPAQQHLGAFGRKQVGCPQSL
jgi:hypothetical protein